MLSQVNSSQKEKNNFCIFLTHLIALTGGFSLLLSGEGTSPGLGVSHKNAEGTHCVFLSLGLVTEGPCCRVRCHPPKVAG